MAITLEDIRRVKNGGGKIGAGSDPSQAGGGVLTPQSPDGDSSPFRGAKSEQTGGGVTLEDIRRVKNGGGKIGAASDPSQAGGGVSTPQSPAATAPFSGGPSGDAELARLARTAAVVTNDPAGYAQQQSAAIRAQQTAEADAELARLARVAAVNVNDPEGYAQGQRADVRRMQEYAARDGWLDFTERDDIYKARNAWKENHQELYAAMKQQSIAAARNGNLTADGLRDSLRAAGFTDRDIEDYLAYEAAYDKMSGDWGGLYAPARRLAGSVAGVGMDVLGSALGLATAGKAAAEDAWANLTDEEYQREKEAYKRAAAEYHFAQGLDEEALAAEGKTVADYAAAAEEAEARMRAASHSRRMADVQTANPERLGAAENLAYLIGQGFGPETAEYQAALAALEAQPETVDFKEGNAYTAYQLGHRATQDAQLGETEGQKFVHSAAISAGENLLLNAVNPALILPILSGQSAGGSVMESADSGDTAQQAFGKAAAKFGAGWAINSVGVTQLAQASGKDYAANSVAKAVVDWMTSNSGGLATEYPVLFYALTGGADNAVQAFVENLVDKFIDGKGAETLTMDSILEAAEAGLSGGLSGFMGGGIGGAQGVVTQRMYEKAVQRMEEAQRAKETEAARQDGAGGITPQALAGQLPFQGSQEVREGAAESRERAQGEGNAPLQSPAATASPEGKPLAERQHADVSRMDDSRWDERRRGFAEQLAADTYLPEAVVQRAADNLPAYAPEGSYERVVNSLGTMGMTGIAKTYERAVELMDGGTRTDYEMIRAAGGADALEMVWNEARAERIRSGAEKYADAKPAANGGEVRYEGRAEVSEAEKALISLTARAADVSITVKDYLENHAWGSMDSEKGHMELSAEAKNKFETMLHETLHHYNGLAKEKALVFQTRSLEYMAEKGGFGSVNEMITARIEAYQRAGQELTVQEAAEEVAADAVSGIFNTKEAFAEWVEFQRGQAAKNAESKGKVREMVDWAKGILDNIIKTAKSLLAKEPGNRAAQQMARLAEEQKAELRKLYYELAGEAMDNARAMKRAEAAEGGLQTDAKENPVRYKIRPDAIAEIHKAVTDKNYSGDIRLTDSTPNIMLWHKGVRNLPMVMKASHIRENILTESDAKKLGIPYTKDTHFHELGEKLFVRVIDGLNDVKEAYRGTKNAKMPERREKCFLLISQVPDQTGNKIMVPVYIEEKAKVNRVYIQTNKIGTVFGRSNLDNYIQEQIRNKNLVRIKIRGPVSSEAPTPLFGDYADVTSLKQAADQTAVAPYEANITQSEEKGKGDAGKKRYMFAGVDAQTADRSALEVARERVENGEDAEAVRRETGWFKGRDGQWRFEIDDSKVRFYQNRRADVAAKADKGFARYDELMNKVLMGMPTKDEIAELRELEAYRDTPPGWTRLVDYLDAPELYKAYPELKELPVVMENMEHGEAYFDGEEIHIKKGLKPEAATKTLLHEIQHWVQDREGFTEGASLDYWESEMVEQVRGAELGARYYRGLIEDVEAGRTAIKADPALLRESMQRVADKNDPYSMADHWAAMEKSKEERKAQEIARLEEKAQKAENRAKSLRERNPADLYWNTAGEIEARDTEARRWMNAEQRRETAPDMGDERTVFANGAGKSQSLDPDFAAQIDAMNMSVRSKDNGLLHVGTVSEALQSIGVKSGHIYWNKGKIRAILNKHSAANKAKRVAEGRTGGSIMTADIIKQVPDVLENPVLILHSDENQQDGYKSRIYAYGEVYDKLGQPVNVSLELLPTNSGLQMNDIVMLSSYGKTKAAINGDMMEDQLLYVDPDKKRTDTWLQYNGLSLPVTVTKYGSINRLTYFGDSVKVINPDSQAGKLLSAWTEGEKMRYSLPVDEEVRSRDTERAAAVEMSGADAEEVAEAAMSPAAGVHISDDTVSQMAKRYVTEIGAKMPRSVMSGMLRSVFDYLEHTENPSYTETYQAMQDIVETAMKTSNRMDSELWDTNTDLHRMGGYVAKGTSLYNELVYKYGSFAAAQREMRKHGVYIVSREFLPSGKVAVSVEVEYRELCKDHPELFDSNVVGMPQLDRMAEVWDQIRPTLVNNYGETWAEAVVDHTNMLMQDVLTMPEFADSVDAAEMRRQLVEHNTALRETALARTMENAEAIRSFEAEQNRAALEKLDKSYRKKLEAQRAAHQGSMQRLREMRAADALRPKAQKAAYKLINAFEHPSKNAHVSGQVASELYELAKLGLERVKGGKAREEHMAKLMAAAQSLRNMSEDILRGEAVTRAGERYTYENSPLPGLIEEFYRAMGTEDGKKGRKNSIYKMNSEQLRAFNRLMRAAETYMHDADRLVGKVWSEANAESMNEQGSSMVKVLEHARDTKPRNELMRKVSGTVERMVLQKLSPERAFRMIEGYDPNHTISRIMQDLNEGQREMLQVKQEGEGLFAELLGKGNRTEMARFTGKSAELIDCSEFLTERNADGSKTGEKVLLTPAELAMLSLQVRNEQNLAHILEGGLKVLNREAVQDGDMDRALAESRYVTLMMAPSAEDGTLTYTSAVDRIMGELLARPYAQQWADKAWEYWNGWNKDQLNKASRKLVGFDIATVEGYVPIRSDNNFLQKQVEGVQFDKRLTSDGSLKERTFRAGNPIVLETLDGALNRSIDFTAKYVGLAMPLRNANRLLNWQGENYNTSFRRAMEQAGYSQGVKLMENLLTNLQVEKRDSNVLAWARGAQAASTLTLNVKTAMAQCASLPTAMAVMGYAPVAKSLGHFVGNVVSGKTRRAVMAEINEHNPIMWQRHQGNNTYGLSEMSAGGLQSTAWEAAERGNLLGKAATGLGDFWSEHAANWLNSMDEATVSTLWQAAKIAVEDSGVKPADGEATYWDKVNRVFMDTVEATQPMYTVMQRSDNQRNGNEMLKALTMFNTQRNQNFGILADAAGELGAVLREPGLYSKTQKAEIAERFARAGISQLIASATISAFAIVAKGLLRKVDDWRDDETGEVEAAKMVQDFGWGMVESFVSNSDLANAALMVGEGVYGFRNGGKYDIFSVGGVDMLNDTMNDLTRAGQALDALASYTPDEEDTEEEIAAKRAELQQAVRDRLFRVTMDFAQAGRGVPVNNAKKIADAVTGYAEDLYRWTEKQGLLEAAFAYEAGAGVKDTQEYNRLAFAIADYEEALVGEDAAALEEISLTMAKARYQLERLGKGEDTVLSGVVKAMKQDENSLLAAAAAARLDGDGEAYADLMQEARLSLYRALGMDAESEADAGRRARVDTKAENAVKTLVDAGLGKNDKRGTTVYTALEEAIEEGDFAGAAEAVETLRKAGKADKDIKSDLTKHFKPLFLAADAAGQNAIMAQLKTLGLYEHKDFVEWKK